MNKDDMKDVGVTLGVFTGLGCFCYVLPAAVVVGAVAAIVFIIKAAFGL